jgi:hypothetical protein
MEERSTLALRVGLVYSILGFLPTSILGRATVPRFLFNLPEGDIGY